MFSISLGTTRFLELTKELLTEPPTKPCLKFTLCTLENTNTANRKTVRRFMDEVRNSLFDQEEIKFLPQSQSDETGINLELSRSKTINQIVMDMIFLKGKYHPLISKTEFRKWKFTISCLFSTETVHALAKELLQQELISPEYYENFVSNPCPSLYQLSLESVFRAVGNHLPHIETLPLSQEIKKDLFELIKVPEPVPLAVSAPWGSCINCNEWCEVPKRSRCKSCYKKVRALFISQLHQEQEPV